MNQGLPGKSQAAACNLFPNDIGPIFRDRINHLPRWELCNNFPQRPSFVISSRCSSSSNVSIVMETQIQPTALMEHVYVYSMFTLQGPASGGIQHTKENQEMNELNMY